jgi:hypothetical protein
MQTLWFGPAGYMSGDPSLRIIHPSTAHPGKVISSTTRGANKWVSLDLAVPEDACIEHVVVCYQLTSPRSFIS